jgi:aryl-alcohol dehydrogenase-like predicted oxidoreductase
MDETKLRTDLYHVPYSTEAFNGMPYRYLGSCGLQVPNIGLGTWKFGYPETGDESRVDEKTAFSILDRALELGVTLWDTANRYNSASGNSERIIGKWLKNHSEERRNVIIATKIGGSMDGRTPNHGGLSRGSILDAVRASLARLQTDYIDLLYFHHCDGNVPIEESLSTVEDLVSQGLIRYFGVSNYTVSQLEEVLQTAGRLSVRCRPAVVQNRYDVLQGEASARSGVLAYAAGRSLSFIAWSPLARGLLTNRYLDISEAGRGDRLYDEGLLEQAADHRTHEALTRLAALSARYGWQVSQMILAYMLTMPGMGPAIPSASSVSQLESNAAAGTIALSKEQIEEIASVLRSI